MIFRFSNVAMIAVKNSTITGEINKIPDKLHHVSACNAMATLPGHFEEKFNHKYVISRAFSTRPWFY